MNSPTPPIQIENLTYAYGRAEAVHDLSLTVQPGRCYGLFGRNGAGKTTTMKCLLNLLRPQRGQVRVFGLDPAKHEVEVKRSLSYVPDQVAFYPWMSVRETLDYLASFRANWNRKIEQELFERFQLDPAQRTGSLSKGQRTQVALVAAVCPETDLLVLDEPTSGLDPIVRREFIEAVIGAYQQGIPGHRTILVSTHLITEFEGLIDEFTHHRSRPRRADPRRRPGPRALSENPRALCPTAAGNRPESGIARAPRRPRTGVDRQWLGRRIDGAPAAAQSRSAFDGVADARGNFCRDVESVGNGGNSKFGAWLRSFDRRSP